MAKRICILSFVFFHAIFGAVELLPWHIIYEPGPGDRFGWSVASGDFDGDGALDIAVGAPFAEVFDEYAGVIYIYFAPDFDTPGLTIPALHSRSQIGISLDCAGDFNGDGYDDLLAGANTVFDTGAAYIFFGGPDFDSLPDVTFFGENHVDNFGYSSAGLGDMNGDGFDDVAVTSLYYRYIAFDTAFSQYFCIDSFCFDTIFFIDSIYIDTLPMPGFFPDTIYIDTFRVDSLGRRTGRVYIYFGGDEPDSIPDIVMSGLDSLDDFGTVIDGRFDFDNDGVPDILVGAVQAGNPYIKPGAAYALTGNRLLMGITQPEFKFTGELPFNFFGGTVAVLGDVNGDGFDDVISGAYNYAHPDIPDTARGRVYVYFGKTGTSSPFEIPDLIITGRRVRDYLGGCVGGIRDINGDGFADFAVSADWDIDSDSAPGVVLIYTGAFEPDTIFDFFCRGSDNGENFGATIECLGDITGDGYPDFAVSNAIWGEPCKVYIYEGFCSFEPFSAEVLIPFDGAITSDSVQETELLLLTERVIDEASIMVTVDDDTIYGGDHRLLLSGDSLSFVPDEPFADGDSIKICLISARTIAGDPLSEQVCVEFLVDLTPPVKILAVPEDSASVFYRPQLCAFLFIDSVSGRFSGAPDISIDGEICANELANFGNFAVIWTVPESASFVQPREQYQVCVSGICDSTDFGEPNCAEEYCVAIEFYRQWLFELKSHVGEKEPTRFYIGQASGATDSYDPALDILMLPLTPAQTNVKLRCEHYWLFRDFRAELSETLSWIIVNIDTGDAAITWNSDDLPTGAFLWNREFDMSVIDSIILCAGDTAEIFATYGSPQLFVLQIPFRWGLLGFPAFPAYNNIYDMTKINVLGPLFFKYGGYFTPDYWLGGKGFFTFGFQNTYLPVWAYPADRQTHIVERKWNLLSPPIDSASVMTEPPGIFLPPAYRFEGDFYYDADEFNCTVGYWMFFIEDGIMRFE